MTEANLNFPYILYLSPRKRILRPSPEMRTAAGLAVPRGDFSAQRHFPALIGGAVQTQHRVRSLILAQDDEGQNLHFILFKFPSSDEVRRIRVQHQTRGGAGGRVNPLSKLNS